MECTRKMYFLNICYQFPLIIKTLLGSQMYVVTSIEFIFSISLLISSIKIRNRKMSLLVPVSFFHNITG